MSIKKLFIVTTHPIQYQVPLFRELSKLNSIEVTVLFGMLPDQGQQSEGFNTEFTWDIPLLEGYKWKLLENVSANPSVDDYQGCDTPGVFGYINQMSPDAVLVTGWNSKMLIQGASAGRNAGALVMVRGDSNAMRTRPLYKKLAHRVLLKKFDKFLAVGHSNRIFYQQNGIADDQILDSPHFVENSRFANSHGAGRNSFRSKAGLKPSDCCFVYCGKLIEKKHVAHLLEAFSILHQDFQNTHLLIIGDGPLRSELEAFSLDNDLPVSFTGFINQSKLPEIYRFGDCLVLPSDFDETWGLVVNEAMACGLPAIVSDQVGCGPDLILPGETGEVYPFGMVESLCQSMRLMVENDAVRVKMGQNANNHVLQNYTLEKSVQAVMQAMGS